MHIPYNSKEARIPEAIIERDHFSPMEAVMTALSGIEFQENLASTTHQSSKPKSEDLLTDDLINN